MSPRNLIVDSTGLRRGCSQVWVIGALLLAAVTGVVGCGGGGSAAPSTSTTSARGAIPAAASIDQLRAFATSAGHPVFWAGPAHATYELTRIADGRTYIRYLPPGVPVGSSRVYLTIGTYVRPAPPYAAVRQAGLARHAVIRHLAAGELAVQYRSDPRSVYLVFPGALWEVEVFDPSPSRALLLAASGKVVPLS